MYTGNGHAPDKFIINEETMCILHNKSNGEALTKKLIKRNVITINSRHIYLILEIKPCGFESRIRDVCLETSEVGGCWDVFFLPEVIA